MTRLMRSIRHFPPLLFVLALLVSCDDDPVAGPDSDGSQLGIVVGRIDPGLVPTATDPAAAKDAGSAGPTVTAEELLGDGSLEPRATAGVNEDFTYRIGDIPIGSDGLVITAASEGADIGRVIVHGPVEGAVSVTAAPMNDETTVEAQVLIELVGTGLPPEALNTVELSLLVELDPGVARDVTVSAPDIGAIAEGLAANDAILDGVLDLDGATRFDATQQARRAAGRRHRQSVGARAGLPQRRYESVSQGVVGSVGCSALIQRQRELGG
ncbi:MAG: hypothetical protein R3324_20950, partial [Halobacteriales archaeon]|nr:hypothetical protein [Halobacteriales archaeon]